MRLASRGRGKDDTAFITVVAFGKLAELCRDFVKKPDIIFFTGELKSSQHEGKEYWEVLAERVEFGPKRKDGDADGAPF